MIIEQKLYQILSLVVPQVYPISAPVGTTPPYTIYRILAQDPLTTNDGGTVTGIKHWVLEFTSFGVPGSQYGLIDTRTQTIMDTLLPYRDPFITAVLLKTNQTHYDTHYKMDASIVEFDVWENAQ